MDNFIEANKPKMDNFLEANKLTKAIEDLIKAYLETAWADLRYTQGGGAPIKCNGNDRRVEAARERLRAVLEQR